MHIINNLNHKVRRVVCHSVVLLLILSICGLQILLTPTSASAESSDDILNDLVQPSFSSPLPLLIFDSTNASTVPNFENNFFQETEILSSNSETNNSLSTINFAGFKGMVQNITELGGVSDKKYDFFIRLEKEANLLGLKSTSEYLLLGGRDDKSLIRNYLGFSLAKDIFADASDIQLCELLIREGDEYRYQGVYLLVGTTPMPPDGVLLQRSTQGVEEPLETYADQQDDDIGELTIPFRKTLEWDDRYNELLGRLSWTEEVLYNTDSSTFYQYQEMLDVESFVSGFILGELTANYHGMFNSYYFVNNDTGRISFVPLWNFTYAFDNDPANPVSPEDISFIEATYFRQLFKSPHFANEVKMSYLHLRKDALDEETLLKLIDEAVALVSPAVERDWARWHDYRHVFLQPSDRQTDTFGEEILSIKTHLREHSLHFALELTELDVQEQEIDKEIVLNSNPIWIVVFLVFFFLIVRFVRKYGV